jgi:hypothetical protein
MQPTGPVLPSTVLGSAVLQQPVLHLDAFDVYSSLCCSWTYLAYTAAASAAPERAFSIEDCSAFERSLSTAACAAPGRVCQQHPVLNLDVYVYCSLCFTLTSLSTAVCAAP